MPKRKPLVQFAIVVPDTKVNRDMAGLLLSPRKADAQMAKNAAADAYGLLIADRLVRALRRRAREIKKARVPY